MRKESKTSHVGGGFNEVPSGDNDSLSDYDNLTNDIDSSNEASESKLHLKNGFSSCLSKTSSPTSTVVSNSSLTQLSYASSVENSPEECNCKYSGQTIARILHTKQRIRRLLQSSKDGGREISKSRSEIHSHSKTKPAAKTLHHTLKPSTKPEKIKEASTASLMRSRVSTKTGLHRTKSDAGFLRLPASRHSAISGNGEPSSFEKSKRRSWMSNTLDMRQKKKDSIQSPQMLAYQAHTLQNSTETSRKIESPKLSLNANNNNSKNLWNSKAFNLKMCAETNTTISECLGFNGKGVLENMSSPSATKEEGNFAFIRRWSKRSSFRRKKEERKSLPPEATMYVKVQDDDVTSQSLRMNDVTPYLYSKASKMRSPTLSTMSSQMKKDVKARPSPLPNNDICNHKPKVSEKAEKKPKAKQRFLAKFIFQGSKKKNKSSTNKSLSFSLPQPPIFTVDNNEIIDVF